MTIRHGFWFAATMLCASALMSAPFFAAADSVAADFEDPPYTLGTINAQDGWTSTGAAGSGCAVYDHAVNSSLSTPAFGDQSLRVSNAVTSGCFGDQTFSKPLTDAVGETGAGAGSFPVGTMQDHFEMEFDIASAVPGAQQPGLFMSVSPDRGDGSRMSYLGFSDDAGGITINFFDVQGTTNPANFVGSTLGTYSRAVSHHIKLTYDPVDGPSNDMVRVYIDGVLEHVGTSWENYYRYDSESSAEQNVRAVRTVLFRTGGTAAPANAGNGYLVDNLSLTSGANAAPTETTTVVTAADLAVDATDATANPEKWYFFDDTNNLINNALGSFVDGPATAPLGDGSAETTLADGTSRTFLATSGYGGTTLASIAGMSFAEYMHSGVGTDGQAPFVRFNVDFDGTAAFQGSLVFVPVNNGSVVQDSWQTWQMTDLNSKWIYSRPTWPAPIGGPGTTPHTWAEILSAYPSVRMHPGFPQVGMRNGHPGPAGLKVNFDAFTITIANDKSIFDFENVDSIPPVVTVPATTTVTTSSGSGAVVTFTATANDNVDGPITPTCVPPSGSTFPLGTTQVTCSATDAAGNTGTASFNVVVNPAPGKAAIIINKVANGGNRTFEFELAHNTFPDQEFTITTSSGTGSKTLIVNPGTYSLTEEIPFGWTINSNTCATVTVVAGDITTCTVTNTKAFGPSVQTGSIKVSKFAFGGNGTFSFTSAKQGGGPGFGSFSITTSGNQGSRTISGIPVGTYSITEIIPPGWTQNLNGCSSVTVTAGQTTNCGFINTD